MPKYLDDTGLSRVWTKIKTLVSESGDSLEMPIIKYVGARDVNNTMLISASNPLTITVKVIGGTLQVGDELQFCEMKLSTWSGKKGGRGHEVNGTILKNRQYRLHVLTRYVITSDDINSNFLRLTFTQAGPSSKYLLWSTAGIQQGRLRWIRLRRGLSSNPWAIFSNSIPLKITYKNNTSGNYHIRVIGG